MKKNKTIAIVVVDNNQMKEEKLISEHTEYFDSLDEYQNKQVRIDWKKHFCEINDQETLGLIEGKIKLGRDEKNRIKTTGIIIEHAKIRNKITQLRTFLMLKNTDKNERMDAIKALVEIGVQVSRELEAIYNTNYPIYQKILLDEKIDNPKIILEEIASREKCFPITIDHLGNFSKLHTLNLYSSKVAKTRLQACPSLDYWINAFADYILNDGGLDNRTKLYFGRGAFYEIKPKRLAMLKNSKDHSLWAADFRKIFLQGLKSLKKDKQMTPIIDSQLSTIKKELFAWARGSIDNKSLTINTLQSLLFRRASERFRTILKTKGD